ncbi:beta-1,3-galactosyl-O-glycosyl-glycoprotein beta-1,6-N-acetylglucosaminyltransferase-like isoform X1 [Dreissena polymorpha]|uniref:beta-1,3-galactosyl-O-glycosyl-glycoprotein beta-1,6-N-acetylglucosaminyltransferase-like isoform X1 n=2 Tax=Dreissena polymorpha TaxID=45954 RepID=UPI002264CF59|nr:beta-1,3-galactosyl-O-glycosyl-glycoprotein beta-1,6-N-acetylglucosaminyltransferase-like isoform X1 [Dreissena polymorpha]
MEKGKYLKTILNLVDVNMPRRKWRKRIIVVCFVVIVLVFISGQALNSTAIYENLARNLKDFSELTQLRNDSVVERISQFKIRKFGLEHFSPRARRRVFDVDCAAIIKGSKPEIDRANELMNNKAFSRKGISDTGYINLTKNCDTFKLTRGYHGFIQNKEEQEFPIAFSILLYKEVEQAERLLRALYTPRNFFCLHVDGDAAPEVHEAVQGIADCLDNVFVVSKKEFIVYAGFSRLQADINCMENLVERGNKWKYFINLPSQQFPIKTNAELIEILKIYNGANDIEGLTGNRRLENRFKFRYVYKRKEPKDMKLTLHKSNYLRIDPPFNITVVKGSAYGVFTRKFVEFVVKSKPPREILDWFRDVDSPDEYYWASLQYNPQIGTPGSFYNGKPDDKPWLAVYAAWGGDPCQGKFVRGVCIFGVGDLQELVSKRHLFVNKFFLDYQPLGLDCIEEWHLNRTADPSHLLAFNDTFYQQLPFINPKAA